MSALAALFGFVLAWGLHLAGAALARRAGRGGGGPAMTGVMPAVVRLAQMALPGGHDQPGWLQLVPLAGIELAGAVFFALWAPHMAPSWQGIAPGLWFCFFALVATTDLAGRWVPNGLVYPAAAIALGAHLLTGDQPLLVSLLGGGLAFGVFALAGWVKPGGLGGGDVKLAAVMGLLFGFPNVLWALLVGGALGALLAVVLLAGKWGLKSMHMPYAPFLCIGAIAALVYSPIPFLVRS